MTPLPETVMAAIRDHAQAVYPRESCGVVIVVTGKPVYVPCANLADSPGQYFVMAPADYMAAEDRGEVIRIVHSHPDVSAQPSEADRVSCEVTGLPWLIVNWPTGAIVEFEPSFLC